MSNPMIMHTILSWYTVAVWQQGIGELYVYPPWLFLYHQDNLTLAHDSKGILNNMDICFIALTFEMLAVKGNNENFDE